MHFNECRFLWLLYWLSVSPPVYLLDEAPSTEYQLARISIVFTFAIFSSADRQANYPEFQRADNKSPHCKSSVLYLGNWAICKTLHQAKDIIFLGS